MDFEKITQPIRTEDQTEREQELDAKIQLLQLEFVDRYTEKEGGDFIDNLEKLLSIRKDLNSEYRYRKEMKDHEEDSDEQKTAIERLINNLKILAVSNDPEWKSKIIDKIREAKESWGPKPEKKDKATYYGSLYYNLSKGNFNRESVLDPDARKKFGIEDEDACIEIHFEKYFKSNEGKLGKEVFKQMLENLKNVALDIKKKHNHVRAVYGASWLMGKDKLVSRLGFQSTEKELGLDDWGVWYQFIDQDGQINRQRVEQFNKKGELPVKGRVAVMKVEDFLKKYLPAEEKKEPIILKELNPEYLKEKKAIIKEMKELKEQWDDMDINEVDNNISSKPNFYAVLEKIGAKKEMVEVFTDLKKKAPKWEDTKKLDIEKREVIGKKIEAEIEKMGKYIEKQIDLSDENNKDQ